ncbi:MAG: hypothetical protein KJ000_02850 [Pirellulaceae bacterium]|nr:hypothetical protein [Pirellulaceae bacterium]
MVRRSSACLLRLGWSALLASVLATSGCSGLIPSPIAQEPDPLTAGLPGPSAPQVRVGGDGFTLGDVEQCSVPPQAFADRIGESLSTNRRATADRLVRLYPDLALTILREPGSVRVPTTVMQVIAHTHDQQCSRSGPGAGWSAVVADRTRRPAAYQDYDARRQKFVTHLENGRLEQALALSVDTAAASLAASPLQIDAWRLIGVAHLLDGQPQRAVAAFEQARQHSSGAHPYEEVTLLLLESDARRRAGDQAATAAWQQAVWQLGELAVGSIPMLDPILWERAAYLRPVDCPWPAEVLQRLAGANTRLGIAAEAWFSSQTGFGSTAGSDETVVWGAIGHARLARDEPQAALVALKRAESMSAHPVLAKRLRLAEAKALSRLGQSAAATAMLAGLVGDDDPSVSRPALAMLGSIKLQEGGTQQGYQFLRRAVGDDPVATWAGRTEAEADLGLACLLLGDEPQGMRWLHSAQQQMEAQGDVEQLVQSLENEHEYLRRSDRKDAANAIRQRLEQLHAGS